MNEALLNEVMMNISDYIEQEKLEEVKSRLSYIIQKYNVTKITNELDIWHGQIPECYKCFIITKHIEGASDKTLVNYKNFIEDMLRSIYKPIEEITANDIRAYLYKVQQTRGLSNRTLDNRRSCLSSFFSWIAAEGYIDKNPMIAIKPIKYEAKEREPLTSIEMETVRSACRDKRERAIIEVLYSTACRVTELVRLNISDINFDTLEVKLFGKGNKHRTSYLNARAVIALKEYIMERTDSGESLFVGERKPHNRLTKSAVERIVKQIGDRIGIKLFPHRIRHTSATLALSHGMDITNLQKMLGHSSMDTTLIYAKINQEDVRMSHSKCLA